MLSSLIKVVPDSSSDELDALTGYETITQPNVDYNYVPRHWYNRFAPAPKPGSRCEAWKFNIGDPFVTSPSIFTYQLTSVLGAGDGSGTSSSISYKGQTFDDCDVTSMSVTADARLQTSTIVATVACTNEAQLFPVMFSTTFQDTNYDNSSSTFSSKANAQIGNLQANNTLSVDVTFLISDATADLTEYVTDAFLASNHSGPALVTAYTKVNSSDGDASLPSWWCPLATSKINTTCATAAPVIWDPTLDSSVMLDANGDTIYSGTSNYSQAINNAMQVMLAAVRMDLGNVLPNNILVNLKGATTGDDNTSELYKDLVAPSTSDDYSPIDPGSDRPAQIALEYQCRVEQRKSPGSIFISVVVATVTLFKSGWAVFLLLVTFLAKRAEPEAQKSCTSHEALEARIQDLERQLSTPNLEKET
ncbi:hypothetical protein FRB95_005001 [Tulasnella sp. JGI-2019a]|nr:hypothetical protein FRB95_005001 [Tulasnella sp. JGI-2019a]